MCQMKTIVYMLLNVLTNLQIIYFLSLGEGQKVKAITFHQLKKSVTLLASALKNLGVKKGDRVVGKLYHE